jgi:MoxR-like ATPase
LILDYTARLEGTTPDRVVAALLEHIPAQEKALPTTLAAAKV